MRLRHRLNATHMVYRRLSPLRHDRAEGRGGSVLDKALDASRRKLPILLNDMGAHRRLRRLAFESRYLSQAGPVPVWIGTGAKAAAAPAALAWLLNFTLPGS